MILASGRCQVWGQGRAEAQFRGERPTRQGQGWTLPLVLSKGCSWASGRERRGRGPLPTGPLGGPQRLICMFSVGFLAHRWVHLSLGVGLPPLKGHSPLSPERARGARQPLQGALGLSLSQGRCARVGHSQPWDWPQQSESRV